MSPGALERLLTRLLRRGAAWCVRGLNRLIRKKNQAILALYPDFDSSTAVLVTGLRQREISVVLVLTAPAAQVELPAGVRTCVEGSLSCLWHLMRSRWVMFTHPHFLGLT